MGDLLNAYRFTADYSNWRQGGRFGRLKLHCLSTKQLFYLYRQPIQNKATTEQKLTFAKIGALPAIFTCDHELYEQIKELSKIT